MAGVTCPSPIDAPARAAVRGTLMLRALVGLVVAALLVVVGLPREADLPAAPSRVAPAFVHAALSTSNAVRAPLHAVAPTVVEADDWVGRSASVLAPGQSQPRLSAATGFRPRAADDIPAWASAPPDRPPRHA